MPLFFESCRAVRGLNKLLFLDKKQAALFVVAVLLILVAGLKPVGVDRDSLSYVQVLDSSYGSIFSKAMEPFFILIIGLNKLIFSGSPTVFFLTYAILGVSLKIYAIGKLSLSPAVSIFIYTPLYFILHEMTQIRVGVASALFLLSLVDLYAKRKLNFVLKIAFGTMFHFSAVVGLVVILLNPIKINKIFYLALPIIGILLAIYIPVISILSYLANYFPPFVSHKLGLYLSLLSEGKHSEINVYNIYYISTLVIYYYVIFYADLLKSKYDILLVKITGIMLFSFYGFSSVPVLSFRISEYFGVVLIILLANVMWIFRPKIVYFLLLLAWLCIYFFGQILPQNINLGIF